jgi:hypothetical protein
MHNLFPMKEVPQPVAQPPVAAVQGNYAVNPLQLLQQEHNAGNPFQLKNDALLQPPFNPMQLLANSRSRYLPVHGATVQRMKIAYSGGELNTDGFPTAMLAELSIPDLKAIITAIEIDPKSKTPEELRARLILRVAKTELLRKSQGTAHLPDLGLPPADPQESDDAALGNAYLKMRAAQRPKTVNTHDVKGKAGKENCSLVAAAAVLGRDSEALYNELQPRPKGEDDDDGFFPDPVPVTVAFLKEEGKKFSPMGTVKKEYLKEFFGFAGLPEYKAKRLKDADKPAESAVAIEWMRMTMGEAVPNDQIQKNMAAFVKEHLPVGVSVRAVGSDSAMLSVREGIASMKKSPPGTQFIVFVKGGEGAGAHYIYADNLGGDIHFHDYQPMGKGAYAGAAGESAGAAGSGAAAAAGAGAAGSAHPHKINTPTPAPFGGGGVFTELSFVAFEINTGQIIEYLMKLYKP